SSVSERSATPVPASTRMSLSSSIDVVRRCRPPIPPLQPRILSFIGPDPLLLVENRHAVPVGGRRIAALGDDLARIQLVEVAIRVDGLEVQKTHLDLVPLEGAVLPERLLPELELVQYLPLDVGFHSDRLVDGNRLVLPLDLDFVDLFEDHVLDELAARLADED